MPRELCVRALVTVAVLALASTVCAAGAAQPIKTGTSILFADAKSMQRFREYEALVVGDPSRFAAQLATIKQLEVSDIQYVVAIVGLFGEGVEGKLTTDGERVVIYVSDATGTSAQAASLVSRFAHELEHARQFDSGELGLMRNPQTGVWSSHYGTYDIGDEVKAWSAQLTASLPGDFFMHRKGQWRPTLLRVFANAQTDEERARVLIQNGYSNVNPVFGANVRFGTAAGHYAGEVLRPDEERRQYMFARVFAVGPDHAEVAGVD
jgi:hypothetical protein